MKGWVPLAYMSEDTPAADAQTEVTSLDGSAVVDAALDAVGDGLLTCVAYDDDEFDALYVADEVESMYPSEERMQEHFEQLHGYVHLDFTEVELFQNELLPYAGDVHFLVTGFEALTAVRVISGREGLFLSVTPDTPTDALIDAVRGALD
jgi:hypothetical protein